jgi:hypothetical protein
MQEAKRSAAQKTQTSLMTPGVCFTTAASDLYRQMHQLLIERREIYL